MKLSGGDSSTLLYAALLLAAALVADVRAQEIELTQVGSWTEGHSEAVAVDGTTVFAGVDSVLVILDVSDPAQPVELGRTEIGERPMAVEVRDEHVFLLDERGHLHVVSTADPTAPVVISLKEVRETGSSSLNRLRRYRIVVEDVLVFALIDHPSAGAVHAFDLSDPADPELLGTIGNYASGLVRVEEAFYIMGGAAFFMYEMRSSDPFHTEYAGWVVAESYNAAKRTGSNLIAIGGDFVVYDISVPFEPREVSRIPDGGRSLALVDDLAYVGSYRMLRVIDVADPAEPRLVTSFETDAEWSGTLVDVAVDGELIAAAVEDGGVLVFQQDEQQGPLPAEEEGQIPTSSRLESVYPNPASDGVHVRYRLAQPAQIRMQVYDLLGRRVEVVEEGTRSAGRHELAWRSDGLSAGTYVIQLEMGAVRQSSFVHLVK